MMSNLFQHELKNSHKSNLCEFRGLQQIEDRIRGKHAVAAE